MADFLLDTFTGSGNLATRSGETGATWSFLWGSGTLSNFVLDGAGSIGCSSAGVEGYLKGTGTPAASDYAMEIVATISANGTFSFGGPFIRLFGLDDGSSYTGFELQVQAHNSSSPTLTFYLMSGAEQHYSSNINISSRLGLETTFRVVVTNSRKTCTVYIEGAEAYTFTTTDPVPAPGMLGFSIGAIGHVGNAKISKVRGWTGSDLVPPVPEETGAPSLPIIIAATETGSAALPITIGTQVVGAVALPIGIAAISTGEPSLSLQVGIVSPGLFYGSETVSDGITAAAIWSPVVQLAGSLITDYVIGDISIEFAEGEARIASFTIEASGVIDLPSLVGKPVVIDIADATGTNRMRLFGGVVDLPTLDIDNKTISFDCTDDLQNTVDATPRSVLDPLIGGRWSAAVFDPSAPSWPYSQDRLSTVSASLDASPFGVLRVTPWAAKAVPDLSFDADSVLEQSIKVSFADRTGLVNQVDLAFGYRFPRAKREAFFISFSYLTAGFSAWVDDGNAFLYRAAVVDAIAAAGGAIHSITYTALPTTSQVVGGGFWIPNPATDPLLCLGFEAVVLFDYSQDAQEQYEITVASQASIDAVGLIRASMSGAMQAEAPDTVASETNARLYQLNISTIPPLDVSSISIGNTTAVAITATDDTDRAAAENAIETLVEVSKTKITAAHRQGVVSASVALHPLIDLDKTIAIDAQGVQAQGKVSRGRHLLSTDAGTAITDFDLAITRLDGLGLAHDETVTAAPEGITDGVTTALGIPVCVFNGLLGENQEFTVTFPGVEDLERNNNVVTITSRFEVPIIEDLQTIVL